VSGLSEDATEEGLRYIFSVHMPVADVRLVRDKFSGAPRGFAFVELGSVNDATQALNQLQASGGVYDKPFHT
jgi:RNA-binding protein 5/10